MPCAIRLGRCLADGSPEVVNVNDPPPRRSLSAAICFIAPPPGVTEGDTMGVRRDATDDAGDPSVIRAMLVPISGPSSVSSAGAVLKRLGASIAV